MLICEGWATGSTLAEIEPEALVFAAIDAGNLEPVAVALRARRPRAEIVVCCDADPVGRQKGRAAALDTPRPRHAPPPAVAARLGVLTPTALQALVRDATPEEGREGSSPCGRSPDR